MAIRYFRKHEASIETDKEEGDTSKNNSSTVSETQPKDINEGTKESSGNEQRTTDEEEDSYSESDSNSSSSSEEEITLHRPVFLKRLKKESSGTVKTYASSKKPKIETEDNNHSQLMERVNNANEVAKRREDVLTHIYEDYTTDKELLKTTMQLNDDDTIDPDSEKQEWLKRQEKRAKIHREALVAKQLEFEESQENKMKSSIITEDSESNKTGRNSTSSYQVTQKKYDPKPNYKPQRAKEHQFSSKIYSTEHKTENEYSHL